MVIFFGTLQHMVPDAKGILINEKISTKILDHGNASAAEA